MSRGEHTAFTMASKREKTIQCQHPMWYMKQPVIIILLRKQWRIVPRLFGTKARNQLVGCNELSFHDLCLRLKPLTVSNCSFVLALQNFQLVFQLMNIGLNFFQFANGYVVDALQSSHLPQHKRQGPVKTRLGPLRKNVKALTYIS